MGKSFINVFLIVSWLAAPAGAAPPRDASWKVPQADLDRWAGRVRGLVSDGWTASAVENGVALQRDKPVQWRRWEINAPARAEGQPEPKPDLHEGAYRLTLRFGPKMSIEEHEQLREANAASAKERDRLESGVRDITRKFDDYRPSTPEQARRLAAYREAVAKLPFRTLPDLYCEAYSIELLVSHDGWSSVHGDDDRAECDAVRESVLRFFGMYDPRAAADARHMGRPEPTPPAGASR